MLPVASYKGISQSTHHTVCYNCLYILLYPLDLRPSKTETRSYLNFRLKILKIVIHAPLLQSYLTLCNPMDYSPPGSSVHGIFLARTLEWVATPSSRGSSKPRDWTREDGKSHTMQWKKPGTKIQMLLLLLSRSSRVRLFATPWTTAHQAPLPMGFSRQAYWSGLPLPSPRFRWAGS